MGTVHTLANAIPTPECDKLMLVAGQSETIFAFMDWLAEQDFTICESNAEGGLFPSQKPLDQLISAHFNIDMRKVELERRAAIAAQPRGKP